MPSLDYKDKIKEDLQKCDACTSVMAHPTRPESLRVKSAYSKPTIIDVTILQTTALFTSAFLIFEGYVPARVEGDKPRVYRKLKRCQCQLEWVDGKPTFKMHRELKYLSEFEPIEYNDSLAVRLEANRELMKSLLLLKPRFALEVPRINFEIILYDGIVPSHGVQVGDYFDYLSRSEVQRIAYPYVKNPREIKWILYLRSPMVSPLQKATETASISLKVLYEAAKTLENFNPP